eukprot:scaffold40220_cov47-Phaeocystis_antarctica.AAC.2
MSKPRTVCGRPARPKRLIGRGCMAEAWGSLRRALDSSPQESQLAEGGLKAEPPCFRQRCAPPSPARTAAWRHLLERQLGVDRDEHLLHLGCTAPAQHELPGGVAHAHRHLSKARLARVSRRPVWGLLVRSSRPVWHTAVMPRSASPTWLGLGLGLGLRLGLSPTRTPRPEADPNPNPSSHLYAAAGGRA